MTLFSRRLAGCCLMAAVCLFTGCSQDGRIEPKLAAQVLGDLERARGLCAAGDYTAALPILDACFASGALDTASLGELMVMRATAWIQTGAMDQGLAEIDSFEQIADDLSVVHGLRYLYWKKQGNEAKAAAELRVAQQIRPGYQPPP